jgi:hypothetical protein
MADLTCVVCGEPWDAYGVRHGDMLKWEAELFLKGAGCPSCEGVSPFTPEGPMEALAQTATEDPQLAFFKDRLLINPDEGDPASLFAALEGDAPKWEAPAPTVLWQCSGCDVEVIRDPATEYLDGSTVTVDPDMAWQGGEKVHYWGSPRPSSYGDLPRPEEPTETPPHLIADEPYCPGCAATCYDCAASIFTRSELEGGDTHDEGTSFCPDGYYNRSVCFPCLEEHYGASYEEE